MKPLNSAAEKELLILKGQILRAQIALEVDNLKKPSTLFKAGVDMVGRTKLIGSVISALAVWWPNSNKVSKAKTVVKLAIAVVAIKKWFFRK